MTELQMGLIGLGATAVVGVFAYNKWQEHRHRKLAEAVLRPDHDDVLLGDGAKVATKPVATERSEPEIRDDNPLTQTERAEPVFVDSAADLVGEVFPADSLHEKPALPADPAPVLAKRAPPKPVENAIYEMVPGPLPAELLDPRLEFIVAMELVEPVSALQILHSQRDALRRLNKPVHWVGFNERTRDWEPLVSDSNWDLRHLRMGLQLVNRLGPISSGEIAIFSGAMQALADELMAVADMPPARLLDQAAELDRFCAAVDLEIGVNLVSRGSAFSGTKIRALAESAGMVLGIDGLFTRYDEAGRAQFSLQNYESMQFSAESIRSLSTHGLTFLLDVPRVDHGERVFMQMTELAKRFADALQGTLVDDNRQPLSESQLDHIRREFIGKPQATMLAFGLPAGSPQAQRLFS
ncbi:MAG: cell division protein ZipA C-terminal FtsZ-binding domain-containing protein [Azonexus sp.]|nr:cell division protein ZipA C-terminal FtsZ-binding domain-containing protein [Azonexus sp.]MDP3639188.1 cell division protein ZipA C-terminal FtsZ-binding domain-containing protein [Azonexus sp.]MDZ4313571.1 cell division protein ZipA C-terminal FtsZ-binding domain-containing protein [Azonexus sp.]